MAIALFTLEYFAEYVGSGRSVGDFEWLEVYLLDMGSQLLFEMLYFYDLPYLRGLHEAILELKLPLKVLLFKVV